LDNHVSSQPAEVRRAFWPNQAELLDAVVDFGRRQGRRGILLTTLELGFHVVSLRR